MNYPININKNELEIIKKEEKNSKINIKQLKENMI